MKTKPFVLIPLHENWLDGKGWTKPDSPNLVQSNRSFFIKKQSSKAYYIDRDGFHVIGPFSYVNRVFAVTEAVTDKLRPEYIAPTKKAR